MPYVDAWKFAEAIYWPACCEINKNIALQTDFLPNHYLNGDRILRIVANVNEEEKRQWFVSDSFSSIMEQFGGRKPLFFPKVKNKSFLEKIFLKKMKSFLFPAKRLSPYDHFLFRLQNFLKENKEFQKNSMKKCWTFPPLSTWAGFTDSISCAQEKKDIIELIFIIPRRALMNPEKAPISILERMSKEVVVEPNYVNLTS